MNEINICMNIQGNLLKINLYFLYHLYSTKELYTENSYQKKYLIIQYNYKQMYGVNILKDK